MELDNLSGSWGLVCFMFCVQEPLTWQNLWCLHWLDKSRFSLREIILAAGLHLRFHLGLPNSFYENHHASFRSIVGLTFRQGFGQGNIRRFRPGQAMRNPSTDTCSPSDPAFVAIRDPRAGLARTLSQSTHGLHLPCGHGRYVHQMDLGGTSVNDHHLHSL